MSALISNNMTRKPFLPAFGKAAFLLATFAWGTLLIGEFWLDSIGQSLAKNTAEEEIQIVQQLLELALIGLAYLMSMAALVLGVLSILGMGKVDGKSRWLSGSLGTLLASPMLLLPLLLFPAIIQANQAAENASTQSMESGSTLVLPQEAPRIVSQTASSPSTDLHRHGKSWVVNRPNR